MTFTYWLVISLYYSSNGGTAPLPALGPFFSEKACQESFQNTKVLQDVNGHQGPTMFYTCVPMPVEGD